MKIYFDYYNDPEFEELIRPIITTKNFILMKAIKHHHNSTIYSHSIYVAYNCYLRAKNNKKYNLKQLVRGALLHDYFLYDWHIKNGRKGLHGYTHPRKALMNAIKEYDLTTKEIDMIINHMWPLTIFHIPKSKEAWLVSIVDKMVAISEILVFKKLKKSICHTLV